VELPSDASDVADRLEVDEALSATDVRGAAIIELNDQKGRWFDSVDMIAGVPDKAVATDHAGHGGRVRDAPELPARQAEM
jgi:hypothetical protein